jgi:exo-beta-1,3-glucanase (GH17 family)
MMLRGFDGWLRSILGRGIWQELDRRLESGPGSRRRSSFGSHAPELLEIRNLLTTYMLPSIDFSPFINGENPNNGGGQVTEQEFSDRLQIAAQYADGIRTFDCTGDLAPASQLIHELGKKSYIGAWIQNDAAPGDTAGQQAINKANEDAITQLEMQIQKGYVDVAIVGSETQLRNQSGSGVTETELLHYINEVKAFVTGLHLSNPVPVTTADSYDQFEQQPNLLAAVDVVYANFYPFFENQPVDTAISTLNQEYSQLKDLAGSKQVVISETGWPSAGEVHGAAVPSETNAAQYFLNFVTWAKDNNVQYNYFEFCDESWKGPDSNIEAHWGLFEVHGNTFSLKPGIQSVFDGAESADNWTVTDIFSMPTQIHTNLSEFVVSGETAPGNSVEVNGTPISTSDIDAGGAFADVVPLSTANAGNNQITVTIKNAAGQVIRTTTKSVLYSATYSTTGSSLLYVDAVNSPLDGTVVIDPQQNAVLGIIPGEHIAGISADSSEIFMTDRNVYSTANHQLLFQLAFSQPIDPSAFAVSPTGDRLYSGTQVLNLASNTLLAALPQSIATGSGYLTSPIPGGPAISADGKLIFTGNAVGGGNSTFRINTVNSTASSALPLTHSRSFLSDLALSPTGKWLAASSYGDAGGEVDIYDTSSGTPQFIRSVSVGDFAGELRFLDDNTLVVGSDGNPGNGGGAVSVINVSTGSISATIPVSLAGNLDVSTVNDEIFASTGDARGIEIFQVGANSQITIAQTFDLGIQRNIQGTGLPHNNQIARVIAKAAVQPSALAFTTTATPNIPEGTTSVLAVIAADANHPGQLVTYSITGGADQGLFSITNSGVLSFKTAPDFGAPTDSGFDNHYDVEITANDGHGGLAVQQITVAVTDVTAPPQLTLNSPAATWAPKQSPVTVLPQVSVTHTDGLNGGSLTIEVNAVGTKKKAIDQFHFSSAAVLGSDAQPTFANGTLTLQISLDVSATSQNIQSFLEGITFSTKGKGLRIATRSLQVTLTDANGASSTIHQAINVHKKG